METLLGELSQSSNGDTGITTPNEAVNEDPVAILKRRLRLEIDPFPFIILVEIKNKTEITRI